MVYFKKWESERNWRGGTAGQRDDVSIRMLFFVIYVVYMHEVGKV